MSRLRWSIAPLRTEAGVISSELGIPLPIARILTNRNILTPREAEIFLFGTFEDLHDPFLMAGMDTAVEKIREAVRRQEKILIFGDYDVDGVLSVVILMKALRSLGGEVDYFIPQRLKEGYGLKEEHIQIAREKNARLIISVDCGIKAVAFAERAREEGLEVIITDHHRPGGAIPDAAAVLNPVLPESSYPYRNLAGVGVVFKLLQGLLRNERRRSSLPHYAKLVAIGTIADVAELRGENRLLVKMGLRGLESVSNIGLKSLLENCSLDGQKITEADVGFRVAPRINAAGRMGAADDAVQLFFSSSREESAQLAARLGELNAERQGEEDRIFRQAMSRIKDHSLEKRYRLLILGCETWHRGVIGIVASKLKDAFYRPVLLFSYEDGKAHGSGRSISRFSLIECLDECRDVFLDYGGHTLAIGCVLRRDRMEELKQRINLVVQSRLREEDLQKRIMVDAELGFSAIDAPFVENLFRLAPFGVGNPKPILVSRDVEVASTPQLIKDRHLKFLVKQDGKTFEALGWDKGELASEIRKGAVISLVYSLQTSTFLGEEKISLSVEDIGEEGRDSMKSSLTRVLRVSVALALVAVVLVIIWYFLSHRRMPSVIAPKVDQITAEKVERQEGIEHFEYRGTRTIQVKAARHFAGDDNRNLLEGNVEIRQTSKEGREEILLSGQKVSYDKDWTDASIEGQAKLKYGRLTVESDFFTYQDSTGILATDRGVRFFSPRLAGKAARLTYSFQDDFLSLEGQVEIRLTDESESSSPFVAAAEVITYSRPQRTGDARGNVIFSWDQSSGRCEALRFTLTENEQYANLVFLTGDVKVDLVVEAAPTPEKGLLLAAAKTREITADEVSLRAFLNMHKIHSVEARGRCFLKSAPAEGGLLQTRSQEMRFVFDRWGGLREFWAVDQASLTERGRDSELTRLITGKEIFVEGQGERLWVKAAEGGEARIDSPDSEVIAGEITLIPSSERLEAVGDVKAVLKAGAKEPAQTGFFSGGQPVYITAKRMRSNPAEKRLVIRESARMWQGNQILSADELTVWRGSGEITGQGNVRASFPYVPKKEEKKDERIEVGGKSMRYASEGRLLTFDQDAWLKTQKVGLNSDAITVHLREEKGDIEKIEARGRVIITEGTRQGKGGEALYDLDKETIVLTGNPSLVDKEKGTVEGDKLTFHLGDGRILVENKDRERPVTIIKS